jgi:hypothetical protein
VPFYKEIKNIALKNIAEHVGGYARRETIS